MPDLNAKVNPTQVVLIILVLVGVAYWYSTFDEQVAETMQGIHDQVADDFVQQYAIAKRSGTPMDACIQAGLVTAGFLQSKNEAEYQKWKKTEEEDCRLAGLKR